MSEAAENFDFMELGQAIQNAREKQRITREELAEELGISARHLQSIEKEGQCPISANLSKNYTKQRKSFIKIKKIHDRRSFCCKMILPKYFTKEDCHKFTKSFYQIKR